MITSLNSGGPLSSTERCAIVEEFWASRNAWANAMNAERRLAWERKWAGIREADLSHDHIRKVETSGQSEPWPSRVLPMRRRSEDIQETQEPAAMPNDRFHWQPKSLPIPMP